MPPDIQGKVKSMDGSGLGSVDVEVDGVSLIMILILPQQHQHPSFKSNHRFRVTPSADNILPRMTALMIWYLAA